MPENKFVKGFARLIIAFAKLINKLRFGKKKKDEYVEGPGDDIYPLF